MSGHFEPPQPKRQQRTQHAPAVHRKRRQQIEREQHDVQDHKVGGELAPVRHHAADVLRSCVAQQIDLISREQQRIRLLDDFVVLVRGSLGGVELALAFIEPRHDFLLRSAEPGVVGARGGLFLGALCQQHLRLLQLGAELADL